jgi:hypothetical protein
MTFWNNPIFGCHQHLTLGRDGYFFVYGLGWFMSQKVAIAPASQY